jgi:hypothetical protein
LFARELTLKTLTLGETRGTWSFQDKCLYFKINNYEITVSDKFYRVISQLQRKYMAQNEKNRVNRTCFFILF